MDADIEADLDAEIANLAAELDLEADFDLEVDFDLEAEIANLVAELKANPIGFTQAELEELDALVAAVMAEPFEFPPWPQADPLLEAIAAS